MYSWNCRSSPLANRTSKGEGAWIGAQRRISHQPRESKYESTVPLSVISISLSSESKTLPNGRRGGAVRCLVVGRGCGVGSASLSLESEGDWRAGISSSVLTLILRCCWVGMPLTPRGRMEAARYSGMVVGGRRTTIGLTFKLPYFTITGRPLILSHGPDFPAVAGCTCPSPHFPPLLVKTAHAFAARQAGWPVPP